MTEIIIDNGKIVKDKGDPIDNVFKNKRKYDEKCFFNKREIVETIINKRTYKIRVQILCSDFIYFLLKNNTYNKYFHLAQDRREFKDVVNSPLFNFKVLIIPSFLHDEVKEYFGLETEASIIVYDFLESDINKREGHYELNYNYDIVLNNDLYDLDSAVKRLDRFCSNGSTNKSEILKRQLTNFVSLDSATMAILESLLKDNNEKIHISSSGLSYKSLNLDYVIEEAKVDVGTGYRDFSLVKTQFLENHNPLKNCFTLLTHNRYSRPFYTVFSPVDITYYDKITGYCEYEKACSEDSVKVKIKAKNNPFL